MCDKCNEFDEKIAHYQRIGTYMTDELTLSGIEKLIQQAHAEKAALHAEERT